VLRGAESRRPHDLHDACDFTDMWLELRDDDCLANDMGGVDAFLAACGQTDGKSGCF